MAVGGADTGAVKPWPSKPAQGAEEALTAVQPVPPRNRNVGKHFGRQEGVSARARMAAAKVASKLMLAALSRLDSTGMGMPEHERDAAVAEAVRFMLERINHSVAGVVSWHPHFEDPYFQNEIREIITDSVAYQWRQTGKVDEQAFGSVIRRMLAPDGDMAELACTYSTECRRRGGGPVLADDAGSYLAMTFARSYAKISREVAAFDFGLDGERLTGRLLEHVQAMAARTFERMFSGLDISGDTAQYGSQNLITRATEFLAIEYSIAAAAVRSDLEKGLIAERDLVGIAGRVLGGVMKKVGRDMEMLSEEVIRLLEHQRPDDQARSERSKP